MRSFRISALSTRLHLVSLVAICLLSASSAAAQKGKPSACPALPPLPASDTKCFFGTPGCLDQSFGSDGLAIFSRPSPFTGVSINQIAVQPLDGKVVAVGSFTGTPETTFDSGLVIRFNPNGNLDTTFGDVDPSNPLLRRGFLIDGHINNSVAIQSDGYIVTGGNNENWGGWTIRRYTPDGAKDTAFGSGGVVATGTGLNVAGLAIQADGKILATGNYDFTVMRLNPNGTRDSNFGVNGVVSVKANTTGFGSSGSRTIAIQRFPLGDGFEERIVLGGSVQEATTKREQNNAIPKFGLMRLRSNGSIDTSFDGDGRVLTDFFGRHANLFRLAIDAENKIVAGGQVHPTSCPDSPDAGFARYNVSGTLDTSFSGDGKANIDIYGHGNYIRDLALQTIGTEQKILGFGFTADNNKDFSVIRLNANGMPDSSFGPLIYGGGKLTYSAGSGIYFGAGAVQPTDNKIIIGGTIDDHAGLVRYLP